MHPWKALPLFLHTMLLSFMHLLGSKAAAMNPPLRNESDRLALLAFRDGISDDPLQVLKSWNSSLHFCEWNGITCSRRHQQRVVALELTGSGLVGHISPFIANLTFLRTCNLSNNNFNGEIPQEMGFLFRLRYLDLSSNSFSGKISAHLSNCSELRNIEFETNRDLGGEIPVELGSLSKLINLDLSRNNFTGNIPSSLGNLSSLVNLNLASNYFTGGIPHELGHLQSLQRLHLGLNELSGVIPPSIYNLSSLVRISVAANRMRGTLLPNIGVALPGLQYLLAGGNEFTVEYLHHHGQTPLVHHDLKPSNVLLDNEMTAHVGDFGLAKFLIETISTSSQSQTNSTSIKGTVGYVAPEYGLGGKSSIQGDVYSYGILLLEMFTGKRPTDDMFKNGLGLHQFAKMALDEHVVEIIDPQLHFNDDKRAESSRIQESLVSIFHIGVACSIESPNDRMDMRDVAAELKVIRDKFLGVGIYRAS